MLGVLDLLEVFELIVESLDEGTRAQQELIDHGHQLVAHVPGNFGDQLQAPIPEDAEPALGNVAAISDELAGQTPSEFEYWFAIIDSAGGPLEG